MKYKTIIAPYEPTVDKIERLIKSTQSELITSIEEGLPAESDLVALAPLPNIQMKASGRNEALSEVKATLEEKRREL